MTHQAIEQRVERVIDLAPSQAPRSKSQQVNYTTGTYNPTFAEIEPHLAKTPFRLPYRPKKGEG